MGRGSSKAGNSGRGGAGATQKRALSALNSGSISNAVYGQLAGHNFSKASVKAQHKRGNIDSKTANDILGVNDVRAIRKRKQK